jgi:YHS domain-containing protein
MGQIRKQILTILLGLAVTAGSLAAAPVARADGLVAAVVTDPLTGVAIGGMDPVSYFTETAPQPGRPDYDYDWGGVTWYFANPANRDVFIKAPDIYAPQFGGHATMSLARGYLSDGKPQIYLVVAERLYLFYSPGNRDAFLLAPGPAIAAARKNWAGFAKGFSPGPAQNATIAAAALPAAPP